MRTILIAAAVIGATSASANPMSPAQLEVKTWQLFKAGQLAQFQALFSKDYVGLYSRGPRDLTKDMRDVHRVALRDYRLSAMKSHAIDPDDVLVTYEVDLHAIVANKPIHDNLWVASLWHRDHRRWLTAYHTEIRAK